LSRAEGIIRNMAVVHISEAEAVRDFAGLLARVRAGEEVVIDSDARAIAVVRLAATQPGPGRLLSESLASAEARGSTVTLDGDFGRDLEAVINSHPEPLENLWD
jgi:antitoxin (DNA-binding transcriptional repressor) of toxin-antitoxin stability system